MPRDCENCGSPSEVLVSVLRVYITPESWDAPGSSRTLDTPEAWCLPCVSMYPAEVIGESAPE
ncbi:MAG: hypothetical protein ACKO72_05100 [Actinomycetes bacterium]